MKNQRILGLRMKDIDNFKLFDYNQLILPQLVLNNLMNSDDQQNNNIINLMQFKSHLEYQSSEEKN